jgi:hypothetical protein
MADEDRRDGEANAEIANAKLMPTVESFIVAICLTKDVTKTKGMERDFSVKLYLI